MQRLERRKL